MATSHKRNTDAMDSTPKANASPTKKSNLLTSSAIVAEALYLNPFQMVEDQKNQYKKTLQQNAELKKVIDELKATILNLEKANDVLLTRISEAELNFQRLKSLMEAEKITREQRIAALEEKLYRATKSMSSKSVTKESLIPIAKILASLSVAVTHPPIQAPASNVTEAVGVLKPPSN